MTWILPVLLTGAVVALIGAPLVSRPDDLRHALSMPPGPITPEVLDSLLGNQFCPLCAAPLAGYAGETCQACGTRWE